MKDKVALMVVVCLAALGWLWSGVGCTQQEPRSNSQFQNEPAARALYDQMIKSMRAAETLSYESRYRWEAKNETLGDCTYTVWLKKPNYFRVETVKASGDQGGILVGDGDFLWIYWPRGRPRFSYEDNEAAYEKTRMKTYMKKPTPLGKHSIGHEVGLLGADMLMPTLDPSTFHGYTDSLQPYVDGVRSLGTEKVGNEECDGIEVSIMKGQRSWYLWLSKGDHLPRRLKEVVRVSYEIIQHEEWSNIAINGEIPREKFVWKPPEEWQQWRLAKPEERLLKPGQAAPDFELASADGSRIKLSDYRGKIVWLYVWRAG